MRIITMTDGVFPECIWVASLSSPALSYLMVQLKLKSAASLSQIVRRQLIDHTLPSPLPNCAPWSVLLLAPLPERTYLPW